MTLLFVYTDKFYDDDKKSKLKSVGNIWYYLVRFREENEGDFNPLSRIIFLQIIQKRKYNVQFEIYIIYVYIGIMDAFRMKEDNIYMRQV